MIETVGDYGMADPMRDAAEAVVREQYTPEGNILYMLQAMSDHGLLDRDFPVPCGRRLNVPHVSNP